MNRTKAFFLLGQKDEVVLTTDEFESAVNALQTDRNGRWACDWMALHRSGQCSTRQHANAHHTNSCCLGAVQQPPVVVIGLQIGTSGSRFSGSAWSGAERPCKAGDTPAIAGT